MKQSWNNARYFHYISSIQQLCASPACALTPTPSFIPSFVLSSLSHERIREHFNRETLITSLPFCCLKYEPLLLILWLSVFLSITNIWWFFYDLFKVMSKTFSVCTFLEDTDDRQEQNIDVCWMPLSSGPCTIMSVLFIYFPSRLQQKPSSSIGVTLPFQPSYWAIQRLGPLSTLVMSVTVATCLWAEWAHIWKLTNGLLLNRR